MNEQNTGFEVGLKIQQKVSWTVATVIITGMISVASLMAVMFVSEPEPGGGGIAEQPMNVADIAKAIVTPNQGWQNVAFKGVSNVPGGAPIEFGNIDSGLAATDGWHDGEAYQLDLPLQLSLTGPHPALNISLLVNATETRTVCVRASTSDTSTLYVAASGNTYTDEALTIPLFTECESVQERALAPQSITSGKASMSYVEANAPSGTIAFSQDNIIIGSGINGSLPGSTAPDPRAIPNSKSPLQTQYFGIAARGVQPSRTFTIQYGSEPKTTTLCLPEAQPPASGFFWGNLYYDKNGSPFSDSLLQEPATARPCNQMLANSFQEKSIVGGTLSTRDGSDPRAGLLLFRDLAGQAETTTYATTSQLTPHAAQSMDGSSSPLVLYVNPDRNQIGSIKARIIELQFMPVDGSTTPQTIALCFPETQLVSAGAGISYSVLYFYDDEGTPYYDNLLTRPVLNASCSVIRSNFLRPQTITSATAAVSLGPWGFYLYNGGDLAGVMDGSTWTPNAGFTPDAIARPLAIVLGGGSAADLVDVPDMAIQLNADGAQRILCLKGRNLVHPGELSAFFDTNGRPFADALLQQPLPCALPTISNIQVTPTATGATISWITDPATTGSALYGTTTSYGNGAADATSRTNHQVVLSGLTPATTYHYKITVSTGTGIAVSADRTFVTAQQSPSKTGGGGKIKVAP